jgi:hypothetical protein
MEKSKTAGVRKEEEKGAGSQIKMGIAFNSKKRKDRGFWDSETMAAKINAKKRKMSGSLSTEQRAKISESQVR